MSTLLLPVKLPSRTTPIAACIAALFGISAHSALAATTHTVTSCDDDGPGTLRAIVNDTVGTVSGDTIDMSTLPCSTISLSTGAITITQETLTLAGPTDNSLQITGKYGLFQVENDRLINHTGTGTLQLNYLNMYFGSLTTAGAAYGGCVYSKGLVELLHVNMGLCYAHSTGGKAGGGAIVGVNGVGIKYSQVSGSGAKSDTNLARGGGVLSIDFEAKYSSVSSNTVVAGTASNGGGVFAYGAVTLLHATLSGNHADYAAGGLWAQSGTLLMKESTVSGNSSNHYVGGVLAQNLTTITLQNSTIAFNTSPTYRLSGGGQFVAPGLAVLTTSTDVAVKMQSSLLSNNSYGVGDIDFSEASLGANTITFDVASEKNLIRVAAAIVPPDTKFDCPYLSPLRANGGPTLTHGLQSHSVAIDAGSNPNNDPHDQRGVATNAALYPRVSNAIADIGAYEVNQDDIIFVSGLDGCNPVTL